MEAESKQDGGAFQPGAPEVCDLHGSQHSLDILLDATLSVLNQMVPVVLSAHFPLR